jgi:hypothetical protein
VKGEAMKTEALKYSKKIADIIIVTHEAGHGPAYAAHSSGIPLALYHEWLKEYPDFAASVKDARNAGIARIRDESLTTIRKFAAGDLTSASRLTAAQWLLENVCQSDDAAEEQKAIDESEYAFAEKWVDRLGIKAQRKQITNP